MARPASGTSIGELLRAERRRAGVTLEALASHLGVSKSQMSLVESGKRSIDERRVSKVEEFLGIDDERLIRALRWQRTPPPIRAEIEAMNERERDSRALAEKLRSVAQSRGRARPNGKSTPPLSTALDDLLRSGELRRWVEEHSGNVSDPLPVGRRIPVINRVAAGYPREFTDLDYPRSIADDYVSCPDISDPDAFAARVVGDSMAPDYREGEIVVFSPALPTPDGCDCFVRLERDNETTFKRVHFEDDGATIRLQPINGRYRARRVRREEVTGLWAAAYVLRAVRR